MSLDFLEINDQDFKKYESSNFDSEEKEPSLDYIKKEETSDDEPEDNNLYKPEKPIKSKKKLLQKAISFAKKNKTLFALGGGGGGIIVTIIILVLLFSQQLPSFAAILASQSLARVNRTFEEENTALTAEKAALDSETPAVRTQTEAKYSEDGELLTDLENYKPAVAINNLDGNGTTEFNYTNVAGGEQLKSIDIDSPNGSVVIPESSTSSFDSLHAPQTLDNSTNITNLSNTIGETDGDGAVLLKFGGIGDIASELGGDPEGGLNNEEFVDEPQIQEGKIPISPQEEAEITLNIQAEQDINPSSDTVIPLSDELNQAIGEVEGQQTTVLNNPSSAATQQAQASIIEQSGNEDSSFFTSALKTITDAINTTGGIAGFLLPLYKIAVPACIIYDGSLQLSGGNQPNASGQAINNNVKEAERSYFLVESTDSQAKKGALSASAIGAMNAKIGNAINSNVEKEASGGAASTNGTIISPEAATDGQYSILSVLAPTLAGILDPIAETICPKLTNINLTYAALLLMFLTASEGLIESLATPLADATNELIGIFTAYLTNATVEDIAADLPASVGAKLIAAEEGGTILTQSALDTIGQTLKAQGTKLWQYLTDVAVIGIGTLFLTQVAKAVVMQDVGSTYDGYSMGLDFANQSHAGGEAIDSQTMQNVYAGAPLDSSQITYNNGADRSGLAIQNSSRSIYQRYIALSNPYSLLSKVTSNIYAYVSGFSLKSLVERVGSIFNPIKLINSIGSLFNKKTFAATTSNSNSNDDYGLVQFGYTSQEQALMNPTTGDKSYQPLENAQILAESGESNYISQNYGACFTEPVGTLMTTTPASTPGGYTGPPLAAGNAYIVRNKDGSIVDVNNNLNNQGVGLCSNLYLGPDSIDPKAVDKAAKGKYGNDLIFRWRLNQAYTNSLSTLLKVQNAGTSN